MLLRAAQLDRSGLAQQKNTSLPAQRRVLEETPQSVGCSVVCHESVDEAAALLAAIASLGIGTAVT